MDCTGLDFHELIRTAENRALEFMCFKCHQYVAPLASKLWDIDFSNIALALLLETLHSVWSLADWLYRSHIRLKIKKKMLCCSLRPGLNFENLAFFFFFLNSWFFRFWTISLVFGFIKYVWKMWKVWNLNKKLTSELHQYLLREGYTLVSKAKA